MDFIEFTLRTTASRERNTDIFHTATTERNSIHFYTKDSTVISMDPQSFKTFHAMTKALMYRVEYTDELGFYQYLKENVKDVETAVMEIGYYTDSEDRKTYMNNLRLIATVNDLKDDRGVAIGEKYISKLNKGSKLLFPDSDDIEPVIKSIKFPKQEIERADSFIKRCIIDDDFLDDFNTWFKFRFDDEIFDTSKESRVDEILTSYGIVENRDKAIDYIKENYADMLETGYPEILRFIEAKILADVTDSYLILFVDDFNNMKDKNQFLDLAYRYLSDIATIIVNHSLLNNKIDCDKLR